jgi:hypothetical protein
MKGTGSETGATGFSGLVISPCACCWRRSTVASCRLLHGTAGGLLQKPALALPEAQVPGSAKATPDATLLWRQLPVLTGCRISAFPCSGDRGIAARRGWPIRPGDGRDDGGSGSSMRLIKAKASFLCDQVLDADRYADSLARESRSEPIGTGEDRSQPARYDLARNPILC